MNETDPLTSISLLRDNLLPNLLKEDEKDILYWAGKELARAIHFDTLDDLSEKMATLFSGHLDQKKITKHTVRYHFSGPLVQHRLSSQKDPNFSLEAGFLAESYQQLTGTYTESTYDIDVKHSVVLFNLQSDQHVTLD